MPPSDHSEFIHSDRLILPRQSLSKEDVGPFLLFMFAQLARKPMRLKLKETAGIARYLKAIARETPANAESAMLNRLAEVLWLTLLDVAAIEVSTKAQTVRFLRQHAHTYLSSFDVERLVEQIDHRAEPSRHRELFRPANLMGKTRSIYGAGPARLQDDLTERIFVAYHAVRRTGLRKVRVLIAELLNHLKFTTRAHPGTPVTWMSQEVIERVRQFGERTAREHGLALLGKERRIRELERLRDMLVDSWIHGFHFARTIDSRAKSSPRT